MTRGLVFRLRTKQGEQRWVELNSHMRFDADGAFLQEEGVLRDITERRRIENTLREREMFLDTIVENLPNMIFVKDAHDLRFARFNRAGEALLGYWRSADYSGAGVRRLILIWLIPPYRLALATHPSGPCIWLPQIGWQPVDRELYLRLERAFSIPMLLIAMLILPILAIEFVFGQKVASSPALALALDLGTASIWIAFAAEFIIMSALAEKKLHYLLRHWINLAIILLPLLAFLRGFQSVRLLRLSRATRLLKVYRLRGLGLRATAGGRRALPAGA